MNKILFYLITFFLVLSCSKDKDENEEVVADDRMADSAITNIYASGKVSEQTAAEAKQTIFGKWDVGGSSSKNISSSKSLSECTFNFIEFTDKSYIMNLSITGPDGPESGSIFGNYALIEADGLVTEVRLYFSISGDDIHIATLTNIEVVEKASGGFDATFDINFEIDLGDVEIVCVDLGGSYSADKEPAMEETLSAGVDSNHYKVVRNWQMTFYSDSEGYDLASSLLEFCEVETYNSETGEYSYSIDPDCIPPSAFQVNLSTFGTYVTMVVDDSGSPLQVETGTWAWSNSDQTEFIVDDDWTGNISSLSTSNWEFSSVQDDVSAEYIFTAVP